jgi:hypothetical protein
VAKNARIKMEIIHIVLCLKEGITHEFLIGLFVPYGANLRMSAWASFLLAQIAATATKERGVRESERCTQPDQTTIQGG